MIQRICFQATIVKSLTPTTMVVEGRCIEGPLKLGDLFKVAFRGVKPKASAEAAELKGVLAQRRISLRIKSIEAYGNMTTELAPSYAGRLVIEGVGVDLLLAGDLLASEFFEEHAGPTHPDNFL